MDTANIKRKLAAILSADVEGYSRLMGHDETSTINTLTAYKEAMTAHITQNRGRVVDAPGDNLLAEFASVVNAVQCAVEIQRELAERNEELPEERKMAFRIGVNLGDVDEEKDRIYGGGVNIAARLENICEGGGVCISGTAFEHVGNKLDLEYEDLGDHEVKNIERPVRVYRVQMETDSAVARLNERLELPDKPIIAVLPFTNLGGDKEQNYFSDGLTEEIITTLSKLPNLLVIDRYSTFAYKGKPVKVKQVAKELGVSHMLEGSVRKSGDKVRITAQLIDTLTSHHLWSERYDRALKDIFEIQDEIAMNILTALQVKLTHGEQARVLAKGTNNLEALEKFWQGLRHSHKVSVLIEQKLIVGLLARNLKFEDITFYKLPVHHYNLHDKQNCIITGCANLVGPSNRLVATNRPTGMRSQCEKRSLETVRKEVWWSVPSSNLLILDSGSGGRRSLPAGSTFLRQSNHDGAPVRCTVS